MYTTARRLAGLERDALPVEKDVPAAMELFQRCIDEQNHVAAMFDLATLLKSQRRSQRRDNLRRAVALYEQCVVESNNPDAKMCLAVTLQSSAQLDVPRRDKSARIVQLYDSCVRATNDRRAKFELAAILRRGAPAVPRDVRRALQLYDSCADEPGCESRTVRGVVELVVSASDEDRLDLARAVRIVEKCIEAVPDANHVFEAVCYGTARKRARRDFEGSAPSMVRLLEICVRKGNHAQAMVILADLLFFGASGVQRDVDRALRLCADALDLTHEQRLYCTKISDLVQEMVDRPWWASQIAPVAVSLCELSMEKIDDSGAELVLAEMLITGAVGVEKNVDRALQLCEKHLERNAICSNVNFLAEKVAYGTFGMARNAPVAVQLCEMCIDMRKDCEAMIMLADIHMSGAPGVERDVDRAVDLCAKYMDTRRNRYEFCSEIINLAKKVSDARFGRAVTVHVAIRLCEICIEKKNDEAALLLQAQLLLTQGSGVENARDRGLKVCETFLDNCMYTSKLAILAEKMAQGTFGIARDIQLAVQLCELCIDKKVTDALFILAEILMTETAGIDQDVDRGMKLCKQYLDRNGSPDKVTDLAQSIAYGRRGNRKDVQLAIQLCEMCIEMNDPGGGVVLGEILMSEGTDFRKDVDSAKQLWMDSISQAKMDFSRIEKIIKDIAYGSGRMVKNVPLAIELCEMFVSSGDVYAIYTLGEILLVEGKEDAEINRALQLCERSMRISRHQVGNDQIAETARQVLTHAKRGTVGNAELALRLIETTINTYGDNVILSRSNSVSTMAELLIATATSKAGIDRAIQVCQAAIDRDGSRCVRVAELARKVAFGSPGVKRDRALAIELCEMCMTKKTDAHAAMTLAEIMLADRPQLERNVGYAMQLCERSVDDNRHDNLVASLARIVATGTEWMAGDAELAVRLCTMCVAKRRDVHAMVVLSEIYASGGCGVEVDMRVAQEWYERAVDEGWLLFEYDRERLYHVHDESNVLVYTPAGAHDRAVEKARDRKIRSIQHVFL